LKAEIQHLDTFGQMNVGIICVAGAIWIYLYVPCFMLMMKLVIVPKMMVVGVMMTMVNCD